MAPVGGELIEAENGPSDGDNDHRELRASARGGHFIPTDFGRFCKAACRSVSGQRIFLAGHAHGSRRRIESGRLGVALRGGRSVVGCAGRAGARSTRCPNGLEKNGRNHSAIAVRRLPSWASISIRMHLKAQLDACLLTDSEMAGGPGKLVGPSRSVSFLVRACRNSDTTIATTMITTSMRAIARGSHAKREWACFAHGTERLRPRENAGQRASHRLIASRSSSPRRLAASQSPCPTCLKLRTHPVRLSRSTNFGGAEPSGWTISRPSTLM